MLETVNRYLSGVAVPLLLVAVGVFYFVRLGALRLLRPSSLIRGLFGSESEGKGKDGGISSARAVTLALAGTLGVGNIVGVSSAIHLGGFGAVFWMWASALVAMILKYAEIVLAMRYRESGKDASAMRYIKAFFASLGMRRLGGAVAAVFAALFLLCSLTMGSMLQSSAIAESLEGVTGLPRIYVGAVLGVVAFFIIRSGTHSLSALTSVLVPVMSAGYIIMSLAVIIRGRDGIGDAFCMIFRSALSRDAAASGVGGFVFTRALRYGVMRGLVSNEAGCGTAPTAHAIADCKSPAKQGIWGIFEVFADTVVLCTMTALVVILEYGEASRFGGNYMMMTLSAYASSLGNTAAYFLCCAVLCFGFATILCWSHYGLVSARYLSKGRATSRVFMLIYCGCVFVGAFAPPSLAWQLSDLAMGAMTLINLAVICPMWRQVRAETDAYLEGR